MAVAESHLPQTAKIEMIGQLAGGIAHDFNNMLMVILGHAGILLNEPLTEDQRKRVEAIHHASKGAAALTRRLLAFSRHEVFEPRVFNLNVLIADFAAMLRRVIREDIELVTRLGADPAMVKADPNQIETVILNLALNARDAMPGGGTLTIETAAATRDPRGQSVLLVMTDTGSGMTEEVKAHLFQPFFTTKGPGRGTGLGLATAHSIITQTGGRIACESAPGRGTAFTISLPLFGGAIPPVADQWVYGELPGGTETVLVVEDNTEVRELVSEILTAQGYAVLEAADPDEALRMSTDHPGPIHLLLTDVVMPGMDGRRLADELCWRRPETKVLYVSGHADDIVVASGALCPGATLLRKPLTPLGLARNVRGALDAPRAPRETLRHARSSSRNESDSSSGTS